MQHHSQVMSLCMHESYTNMNFRATGADVYVCGIIIEKLDNNQVILTDCNCTK